jgi:hypothetical protein
MDPSDANAVCQNITSGHAPTGAESGLHGITNGNATTECHSRVEENHGFSFSEVKGSSYKYGVAGQYQFTALLDHSITLKFKTKIEAAWSKTWNIGRYYNEIVAAKWEIIRPLKEEKVFGKKDDDLAKRASRRYDKTDGVWVRSTVKEQKDKQKDLEKLNKALQELAGAKLEETFKKVDAEVKKYTDRVLDVNTKIVTQMRIKAEHLEMRLKEMDLTVQHIDRKCQEFERKTDGMKAVIDSALEIKVANKGSKGQFVKMKASVQKFMCSVIKLGE